ncbi:hypothetical protein GCM10009839_27020 [Catenulispora yoronensis]|uniref:Uncharacterized protein n=1 Tax=Catenulispora yoronensis TaxID=450799 RepID=A0ABP5FHV6_9ACTN
MTIEGGAVRRRERLLWAAYRNPLRFLVDALPLGSSIEYRLRNDPTTSVDIDHHQHSGHSGNGGRLIPSF